MKPRLDLDEVKDGVSMMSDGGGWKWIEEDGQGRVFVCY